MGLMAQGVLGSWPGLWMPLSDIPGVWKGEEKPAELEWPCVAKGGVDQSAKTKHSQSVLCPSVPVLVPGSCALHRALPFPHLLLRCSLATNHTVSPLQVQAVTVLLGAEGLALQETALYWTTHSVLSWGQQCYLDFERNPGQTFEQSWTWLFAVGGSAEIRKLEACSSRNACSNRNNWRGI